MEKKWYELLIENWAQITILFGLIGYIIKSLTDFWLRKKEITFSRLQENKILELKEFYKSYQQLEIALTEYLYQTEFGEHNSKIFQKIKENISRKFTDFNYNVMCVKLFLDNDDIDTIEEIYITIESIRKDIGKWHIYSTSQNPPEGWDKLIEIMDERLPKKLPMLMKKIESSLRNNLNLK